MSTNYPFYPQRPPYMDTMAQPMGIKGRPVSSLDEARATSIDFDGSVFYFPDLANRRIYTKQINMDGTCTLNVYEYKELPNPKEQNYITREEFDTVVGQIKQALSQTQVQTQTQINNNNNKETRPPAQAIAQASQPQNVKF